MTIKEWLELQGSIKNDFLLLQAIDMHLPSLLCVDFITGLTRNCDEFKVVQLYRMIDGELKRVDKPVFICTTCGKTSTSCGVGWSFNLSPNKITCPDCQKKQEKIKVKPCPRCGHIRPRAFKHGSKITMVCYGCGFHTKSANIELSEIAKIWNEQVVENLTDQIEVSDE